MIEAVIYDMDGLLLDTEPLWADSMLRIAQMHQIPVTYKQLKETTGLRIYEVTDYWATKFNWGDINAKELADEILYDIINSSKVNGRVLDGVIQSLELLKDNNFKIGLASSSPAHMIHTLINHFNLNKFFDNITSADTVIYGKPHPAVFLQCADILNTKPINCLVLEDSLNGVIAGKAARMKVIAVPDEMHFDDPRFALADLKLKTLLDFDLKTIEMLHS